MSTARRFPLPHAAVLLGTLRRALKLPIPKRRLETGRKVLRGKRPLVASGLLDTVIYTLVDAGYFSIPNREEKNTPRANESADGGTDPVALLCRALTFSIAHWQQLVGRANAISGGELQEVATRYLRLATIDFAIRAAAFDVLTKTPSPPPSLDDRAELPAWACHGGVRALMRGLPNGVGATRAQLSRSKTFDDVFDGRHRPSVKTLAAFAEVVARQDKRTPATTWRMYLLWTFALRDVSTKLAEIVGAEAVKDVARAFRRIRAHARTRLSQQEAARHTHLPTLVIEGARADAAGPLIDSLVEDEAAWVELQPECERLQHSTWLSDFRACRVDWLLSEVTRSTPREPIVPEGLPDDVLDALVQAVRTANVRTINELNTHYPAVRLWHVRWLVQQALIRGTLKSAAGLVARFADVLPSPTLYLEAGVDLILSSEEEIRNAA